MTCVHIWICDRPGCGATIESLDPGRPEGWTVKWEFENSRTVLPLHFCRRHSNVSKYAPKGRRRRRTE